MFSLSVLVQLTTIRLSQLSGLWPNLSSPFSYLCSICILVLILPLWLVILTTVSLHQTGMEWSSLENEANLSIYLWWKSRVSPLLWYWSGNLFFTSLSVDTGWDLSSALSCPCLLVWQKEARTSMLCYLTLKSCELSFPMKMPLLHSPVWRAGILLPASTHYLMTQHPYK